MGFGNFNDVLKKLADRIEEKVSNLAASNHILLNRIDLKGFKEVMDQYMKNRDLCKKTLEVKGIWRLDLEYGPQFETRLKTERAGEITIQMDELTLFGGGGTALHPISLCMAGFCGCYSAAYAKWAAMEGIELKQLKIRVKGDLDFSSILNIEEKIPIVDHYQIELFIESDASYEELYRISEITKRRCFCYYCISTSTIPKVTLKNEGKASLNHNDSNLKGKKILNRINLETYKDTVDVFKQDRSLCKRFIEAEGRWRLNVQYGPQFEIKLPTETAGEITVQTDETIILGGGGTSFHPVALCIAGFSGDFATHFATLAGLHGIELKKLETHSKMHIDLTTGFGIQDGVSMIDDFEIELKVESNVPDEELIEILELTKKRTFCHYCYSTPVFPDVFVRKIISKEEKQLTEEPAHLLGKKEVTPINLIHIDDPHNIKVKIGRDIIIKEL
ncbi:MAG: OsmC family protein [Candidatus Lokiarchaeota archaeon]|nr:OsmC family protein [Candidatus Lokiarchaeota archaeon]